MTKAEQYFQEQMKNKEFSKAYSEISEQVDLEWRLERVKNYVKDNAEKNIIIQELEKLQEFVHNAVFLGNSKIAQ
jgi:hypothetical protein